MDRNQFREQLFALALEKGCEAAETYYAEDKSFSVNASEGEIDRYDVSAAAGLSLRVQLNGKNGYAYTECLDDPRELVRRAMDNAQAIGANDDHPMQGRCQYPQIRRAASPLEGMDEAEKIRLALRLESRVKALDPRVQRCIYATLEESRGRVAIHNTLGLAAERETGFAYCYCFPAVSDGREVKTGMGFCMGKDAADIEACAQEAVENAVTMLGAVPADSGNYRVILQNLAFGDLLAAFSPVFSADEAQKGLSLLKGREGEQIASAGVTVTDDPFTDLASRAFDDEGTPCQAKNIIEKGVLKTLLHNLKTAKKAGCQSTGNAVRASAASPVEVGPSVLRVACGQTDFQGLLQKLGNGLVITELEGLHAGLDTVSGDFSLKAAGYLIKDGKRAGAVSQVTVAGNFLTLMKSVECVGSDFRYALPSSVLTGSPSILVSGLQVAGK